MSHRATHWAFGLKGLQPAEKLVLLVLADRHNNDHGCFPSQKMVAEDANLSRSQLNLILRKLEDAKLLVRIQRRHSERRTQLSTRYIFAFEPEFTQHVAEPSPNIGHGSDPAPEGEPCPNIGHGSESDSAAEPCPISAQSRVRSEAEAVSGPSDTNLEGEPGREPGKEEEERASADADGEDDPERPPTLSEDFWRELLDALGVAERADASPWWLGSAAREHVRRWRDDLGVPEARILVVAAESRNRHPDPPDGPKALDRAMEREARRLDRAAKSGGSRKAPESRDRRMRPALVGEERDAAIRAADERLAEWIKGPRPVPVVAVSNDQAHRLVAAGLVSQADLRAKGLPW